MKDDSISNDLVRNYRFLFTLPHSTLKIYLLAIFLPGLSFTLELARLSFSIERLLTVFLTQLILQAVILEVFLILLRNSSIISRKRLAASFVFINSVWFVLALVSLLVVHNLTSFIAVSFINSSVIISFTLLIIWSLFEQNFSKALFVSIFNVLPQWMITLEIGSLNLHNSYYLTFAVAPAIILILLMAVVLNQINNSTSRTLGNKSFDFLKGFLDSWMNSNSNQLEDMIAKQGDEKIVKTGFMELITESGRKLCVVIPCIHPGPFYPVGSYDLPEKIIRYFTSLGYDFCFVLHGPVDHVFNLQTGYDTDKYIQELDIKKVNEDYTTIMSLPRCYDFDSHQIIGIKIHNSIILFISAWPGGAEDYPPSFIESIERLDDGKMNLIVIDSHNALGETPTQEDVSVIIKKVNEILPSINSEPLLNFSASFSIIEKKNAGLGDDVGLGGIGILLLQIGESKNALIIADSNNATKQVKSQLTDGLKNIGIKLIELATSDTHFNATRIHNERGYLLLGEGTPSSYIVKLVIESCIQLSSRLEPAKARIHVWSTKVKLAKKDTFLIFRNSIKNSLRYLKLSIIISGLLVALGYIVTAYLL